jgi:hypothetical protein
MLREDKLIPITVKDLNRQDEWFLSPECASSSGLVLGGKLISGASDPVSATSATELQSVIDKLMLHASDGRVRLVWEFRDMLVDKGFKVNEVGLCTLPMRPSMTWFDILVFRALYSAKERGLATMYTQHDPTCGGSYIAFALNKIEKLEPKNVLNEGITKQFRKAGRPKSDKEGTK